VRRRIAAVLRADAAGITRALAENEEVARARLEKYRAVIRDIVVHGGGRMLPSEDDGLLAEFQSAVEASRAAIGAQETLRANNKLLPLGQRLEFKVALAIGEIAYSPDGTVGEVPPDTLAAVTRLVGLAAPGGVCISQSVREAVASKLKVKFGDMTVEGEPFDPELSSKYKVTQDTRSPYERGRSELRKALRKAGATPWHMAVGGAGALALLAAVAITVLPWLRSETAAPAKGPNVTTLKPAGSATQVAARGADENPQGPKGGAGKIEFMPAHAPDPAAVLSASRMLPQAFKTCQEGSADAAVAACKTVIDSGLAKEDELAMVQVWNGRALRDRHELDKALDALSLSLAAKPTPTAYSLRGTVFYDKGDWDKAIADYSEAIRLDARNGEAYNNRAWTYYRTGRSDKALTDADAAVKLLGKQAYVWDTRGHIHAALGNRDAAIRDFRSALALDPNSADSKAGLAKLGVN